MLLSRMINGREKAHGDVFNILLQLLDDGRVTDSKGNVVNFCNCVVIFTSNVGSQAILDVSAEESESREVRRSKGAGAHIRTNRPSICSRQKYAPFFVLLPCNSLTEREVRLDHAYFFEVKMVPIQQMTYSPSRA